jgi:phospholipase/carboxylesterase
MGLFAVAIAAGFLACDRDVQLVELTREHHSATTIHGTRFATVFERDADDRWPLLVILHGRGDTAEHFRDAWRNFPIKLQLSLPLAPLPFDHGRQWFDWPPGTSDEALAAAVAAAEAKLWPAIAGVAQGRRLFVAGFSQGALVAYAMAIRHPDDILCAFPIAGRLPAALLPPGPARIAPIVAIHGTRDDVIPIDAARRSVAILELAGASAELRELPDVGHTIAPAVYDTLVREVRARLAEASPPRAR